ncbi:uncharacterized protein LOC130206309 [Pseudoliparis swirei]|uniref:uncharacterized protein LOC130206309 n=1 Tax=Pseudoliparis swirei TaxID=2059687 RepID=UPI0024BDB0A7|nr:uncharacterized protein LOC130206309 [Pseudoliparis swirei]
MIGSAEDSVRSALQTQEERLLRIERLISGKYKQLHDQQSSLTVQLRDLQLSSEPGRAGCGSRSPDGSAPPALSGYQPKPQQPSPCLSPPRPVPVPPSLSLPRPALVPPVPIPSPSRPVVVPCVPAPRVPLPSRPFPPSHSSLSRHRPPLAASGSQCPVTIPAGSRPRPLLCPVPQLPIPVLRPALRHAFRLVIARRPTPRTASAMLLPCFCLP